MGSVSSTSSAHTAGPWTVDSEGRVTSRENKFICQPEGYGVVKGENRHGDAEEAMANARLIAAAPELLQVCWMIYRDIETCEAWKYLSYNAKNALEQAVAKAKGNS